MTIGSYNHHSHCCKPNPKSYFQIFEFASSNHLPFDIFIMRLYPTSKLQGFPQKSQPKSTSVASVKAFCVASLGGCGGRGAGAGVGAGIGGTTSTGWNSSMTAPELRMECQTKKAMPINTAMKQQVLSTMATTILGKSWKIYGGELRI
jgi:hypothetical protein